MAQDETNHSFAQGYEPFDEWDYEPTLEEIERVLKHISRTGETFNPPEFRTDNAVVENHLTVGGRVRQAYSEGTIETFRLPGRVPSNGTSYVLIGDWSASSASVMGAFRGWRTGGTTGSGGIVTLAASSNSNSSWSGSFQRQATTTSSPPSLSFVHVAVDGTEYMALELAVTQHHNYDSGLFFTGSATGGELRVVNLSDNDITVIDELDFPARVEFYGRTYFDGPVRPSELVLESPDGTEWTIEVTNAGELEAVER